MKDMENKTNLSTNTTYNAKKMGLKTKYLILPT